MSHLATAPHNCGGYLTFTEHGEPVLGPEQLLFVGFDGYSGEIETDLAKLRRAPLSDDEMSDVAISRHFNRQVTCREQRLNSQQERIEQNQQETHQHRDTDEPSR